MTYFTDIASELYASKNKSIPKGVTVQRLIVNQISVTRVEITRNGLNRPMGCYATLELPAITDMGDKNEKYINAVCNELLRMLPLQGSILVVGVGNADITADALGPLTAKKIFASKACAVREKLGLREVCVITPGVESACGFSTKEHIKAITQELKPTAVICIDSLSSKEPARLGASVQISTSGLAHKTSKELSAHTLGVPVIAVGIPTMMKLKMPRCAQELVITLKAIDHTVARGATLLGISINKALYQSLSVQELEIITS